MRVGRALARSTGPADRAALGVGAGTLVIGGALVARPDRSGRWLTLDDPRAARLVGVLDLALVPGLLLGPRRAPWLAARVALNLAIGGYVLRAHRHTGRQGRAVVIAALLVAASAADSRALRAEP